MNSVLPYSGNRKACRTGCDYEETNSLYRWIAGDTQRPAMPGRRRARFGYPEGKCVFISGFGLE